MTVKTESSRRTAPAGAERLRVRCHSAPCMRSDAVSVAAGTMVRRSA